ncbi:hypothetical protein ACWDR3_32490, partial [Streptomyces sp. NPDC001002]
MSAQFLGLLARDLPPDRLTTDPVVLAAHATDRSGTRPHGEPLAVVHAERTEDVTVTLRHAHALGSHRRTRRQAVRCRAQVRRR